MGAILHGPGVAFRVWAPHADFVSVVGSLNGCDAEAVMACEENGTWYVNVPDAKSAECR
ncbi:hypothetical protein [Adhaeretor mobilis]|uniref:Glycogen branching enzyme n=1 Tax=Adhaeretor mobilis TaxID=1930276 RepID=A0A517MX67_9BACT|nr:hypothetical protein [Adhaeretor mobilis]QDS99463.1 glycogen branching enzyme [Adhaeretor mobilis]